MRLLLANFSKMVGDTGGAAKVHCAFATEMARRGHEVTMVYADDRVGEPFFPLDKRVRVINLQHTYGVDVKFPRHLKLKREVLRAIDIRRGRGVNDEFYRKYLLANVRKVLAEVSPDVIVTWQPTASMIFLCDLQTKIPVISMSHGDPEDYFHTYPLEELPALAKSTVCQVLMPGFKKALTSRYQGLRVEVIGNVLPQYTEQADLAVDKAKYKIIFIGRLVRGHKRPHLLIEAFAQIAARFPDWSVEIWGAEDKCSYTDSMRRTIERAGLADRVRLMGTTHDVGAVLQTGDLFVFPSAYEGFGLTVGEALSMGLPAIGYQSCAAINELIKDGETGLLVADGVEPLAEAMARLMSDRELRIKMGAAAREDMRQYSAERIWSRWEQLLAEVTGYR